MLTRLSRRSFSIDALKVVNNVAKQQFVVSLQGEATLDYNKCGRHITFIRTNVPQEFQGKGVGKLLGQYAFDFALENKLDVTCKCHFLAKYYNDNISKYKDLKVIMQLD